MDSRYNHTQHEQLIYQLWQQLAVFAPAKTAKKNSKPFAIIMPPPNANDPLHLGHAMFIAIEDILVRYHRMLGEPTLWLPGTDHAGIETQYIFEKKLAKQNKSRFDFSRKDLYSLISQYVTENSGVALKQMKQLGASADWSRYKFTLDPDVVAFVTNTFVKMHQDGLIYRDLRLINYCPKCGTSYSELEIKHQQQISPLYFIKYGQLVVATVRPETKFGDVALAVNPKDKRYRDYIGKTVQAQCVSGIVDLPVIASEMVDMNFGTGVLKITPAHDHTDYAIGQKYQLPIKQVIDFQGKIINAPDSYLGLSVVKAREKIVAELNNLGLISKIDHAYSNSVGVCYRCNRPLEPLPLPQFFVKVDHPRNSLVKKSLALIEQKKIKTHGTGKAKVLIHWLKNLHDWNISRQIVWGIRIPVWYQLNGFEDQISIRFIDKDGNFQQGLLATLLKNYSLIEIEMGLQSISPPANVPYIVSPSKPIQKDEYLPETDTLDTWFSSAQWPVVTLKTNKPNDYKQFYPTSVMETAYDILPFWVMRMIMLGVYLTDKQPFDQVYFHGLIRDKSGQKMSKSKGNVTNPIDIVQKYGADALRLALVIRSTAGQDKNISETEFVSARNLTNKIWNAARYVLLYFDNINTTTTKPSTPALIKQQQKLNSVVSSTTKYLNNLKIGQAADKLTHAFKHWYCDELIELHKKGKVDDNFLCSTLQIFLQLLHPFLPFITEAVWQEIYQRKITKQKLVANSIWPSII